jgi:SAM-dependent methyltransferase
MENKAYENWENAYKKLEVTYTEDPRTPSEVELLWNYKVIYDTIINYLPDVESPKVIEVGCGGARNALYLSLRGIDVTCCDYSKEALRLAKSNFEEFNASGHFLLDDLLDSNIPDNTYDCVMSFGLLAHFSDLNPIINNLTRILKPGGIHIHLVIPKKFSTQSIFNILVYPLKLIINLFVRRQPLRGILKRSYRNYPHFENTFTWQEYCSVFEESKIKVLKCEPGGLIIPFIHWVNYVGFGYAVVKLFSRQIIKANEWVRSSRSFLVYYLSQTFIIYGRKL